MLYPEIFVIFNPSLRNSGSIYVNVQRISIIIAQEQKEYIRKGLNTLQLVTCLKFVGHENETGLTDYVDVVVSNNGS